jgi:hypothetical protein
MGKAHIVLEIVLLLQGTPVYDFAQQNLAAQGDKVVVRCAQNYALDTVEGEACKIALEQLEPSAVPRVRARLCDPNSYEAQQDAAAALAACERLSMDF